MISHAADRAVIQRIWGSIDPILLIFAGSAAEFALSKAVDWLFFTRALPNDPITRFFETVHFAQALAFEDEATALETVRAVNKAHASVEAARGGRIPQWSYRDTLFMLVDYGERAHAIVFGPMSEADRRAHFAYSMEGGAQLGIKGLPSRYEDYQGMRQTHLRNHLKRSALTDDLYRAYRAAVGPARYHGLRAVQASLVPDTVARQLDLRRNPAIDALLRGYRHVRQRWLLRLLCPILLPRGYGRQLAALERRTTPQPTRVRPTDASNWRSDPRP
ncbi:MAG: DUF2236 domain-containing protein [Chloroflexi bacterium]|jgi:uncharacterized protein (DUF2236 family)|nr:DUF2236 domain-containing protein [Chloroflexota bacterium]